MLSGALVDKDDDVIYDDIYFEIKQFDMTNNCGDYQQFLSTSCGAKLIYLPASRGEQRIYPLFIICSSLSPPFLLLILWVKSKLLDQNVN